MYDMYNMCNVSILVSFSLMVFCVEWYQMYGSIMVNLFPGGFEWNMISNFQA